MPMTEPPDERRRFQRLPRLLGATLQLDSNETLKLFVIDISLGGLHAAAHSEIKTGTRGTVLLNTDSDSPPIEVSVKVVWAKESSLSGSFHFGLEFEKESELEGLQDLVTSVEAKEDEETPSFRNLEEGELARIQTVGKISRALNSHMVVQELLHQFTRSLQEAFLAERVLAVLIKDGDYSIHSLNGRTPQELRVDFSQKVVDSVLESGRPLVCYEVSSDQTFSASKSLRLLGTRSVLCAPLISNEQVFGVIYMDNAVLAGAFSRSDLDMVTVLADAACVAIDRAELLSVLRQNESDLKAAKLEAEHANTAKTNFLANVSHELRTPINGVLGLTKTVLDSPLPEAEKEKLGIVLRSAHELLDLINDILDYSRISTGDLRLEQVDFSLEELVQDLVDAFSTEAHDKKVLLRTEFTGSSNIWVKGDKKRLFRILTHLLGNAIKFNREGGEACVALTSHTGKDAFTFRVSDTGIGFGEEHLAQVLEPFSQVDNSTTRAYGGLGIGLPLAMGLIKLMEGALKFESKVGSGSAFEFEVPMTLIPAPHSVDLETLDSAIQKLTILVVDDNPVNQMVAASILENWGHKVVSAEHGREALELLTEQHRFDLVYMDLQMPVMDGLEATLALRSREQSWARPSVPVIALTAHGTNLDREACTKAGMDYFLNKPALEPDFMESLRAVFPR